MSLFLTDIVSAIRRGCLTIYGNGKTEPAAERPEEVLLIRHAESTRNAGKKGATYFADEDARSLLRGIPDHLIDITPEGESQARQTGIAMRERFGAPDYVYHSGYWRTMRTCDCMLEAFPESERARIQVRRNPFIRERDPGYAYDMTTAEAEAAFPWLHEHWETYGGFFARPPGGESLMDVAQRVYTFLNTIFRDRAGKKVWVVTHGGTIRSFRFVLERWSYEQALKWPEGQSPKNCGVTSYGYDHAEKRLALREYNATYWANTPSSPSAGNVKS